MYLLQLITYCSSGYRLYRYDISEDNFIDFGSVLPTNNWGNAGFYSQYGATTLYTTNFEGDGLYIFDMSSADPVQQKVSTIPVEGGYHQCLASSRLTGAVYVIGGAGDLKTVRIYDINSSSWSNGSSLNYGRSWHDCIVERTTQILYVVGGWWNQRAIERINVIHIQSESWEVFAELTAAGHISSYAKIRLLQWYGIIFVIGGGYHDPGYDEVYTIDTVCNIMIESGTVSHVTHQHCKPQKQLP